MKDLEVKLRITADGKVAVEQLGRVDRALDDVGNEAAQASRQAADSLNQIAQAANGGLGTMLRLNESMELLGRARDLLGPFVAMMDEWANLQARLRQVTDTTEEYAQAQADVLRIADATSSEIAATADLYSTLTRALKSLGDETTDVSGLTTTIAQALQLSGAGAQASEGALRQLSQALASGVLRGDEFNSVMEQSPRLAQALADALGVTTGQLRGMAEEGRLSAETVVAALSSQADVIGAEFARLPDTIGKASTRMRGSLLALVGDWDQTIGASQGLAGAIGVVAENLETLAAVASGGALGGLAAGVLRAADTMRVYQERLAAARAQTADLTAAERTAQAVQVDALAVAQRRAAGFAAQAAAAARAAEAELVTARATEAAAAQQLAAMKELAIYGEQRAAAERQLKVAIDARAAAEARAAGTAQVAANAQRGAAEATAAATAAQTRAATQSGAWMRGLQGLGGALKQLKDPMTAMTAGVTAVMAYEFGAWLRETSLEALRAADAGTLAARAYDLLASAAEKAMGAQRDTLERLAEVRERIAEQTGIQIRDQKQLNEAIERGALIFDQATQAWRRGSVAMEDLSRSFSKADAGFLTQARAIEALGKSEAEEHRIAQARLVLAADQARARGDEAGALRALAAARDLDVTAAERALELAQGESANREQRIANIG